MHELHLFQSFRPRASLLNRGFTLIEAMVTMAILAILGALASPTFQPLIEKWRVQQAVDNMKSTIYYARSEAIKRGGYVGIQKNANNTDGCILAKNNQEWGCGWFVFVDKNNNGKWSAGEEIVQRIPPPVNTNVMHTSGSTNIKLDRYGMMSGLNAKGFAFVPSSGNPSSAATRGICVSSGGRVRVIEDIPCQ